MTASGKRLLIKEILHGLQESNVPHADMTEGDRARSLQMQSFLKHLEIQMEAPEDSETYQFISLTIPL